MRRIYKVVFGTIHSKEIEGEIKEEAAYYSSKKEAILAEFKNFNVRLACIADSVRYIAEESKLLIKELEKI